MLFVHKWLTTDAKIYIPGVLETPLQFIFVTYLSIKRYSYHLWLRVITKYVKKKEQ